MKHEIYECAFLMPLPTAAVDADADFDSTTALLFAAYRGEKDGKIANEKMQIFPSFS